MFSKQLTSQSGSTILEVMMVLAISGGLLVAAGATISGQIERTRFSTNVREIESKLSDIFNDVETGFYPSSENFGCEVINPTNASSVPTPTGTNREQGTNEDCLFLGKGVQFSQNADGLTANFLIHTIIGRREMPSGSGLVGVTSIDAANPTAFDSLEESGQFDGGVEITSVRYLNGGLTSDGVAVLAPLGSFSATEPSTAASNGKPRLARLDSDSGFGASAAAFRGSIAVLNDTSVTQASTGLVICLRDVAGGRIAAVAVGAQPDPAGGAPVPFGQRLATQAYFDDEASDGFGCTS